MEPADQEALTRRVLDALFTQGGGLECSNILVRHQVESFNEFLDKKLVQIIQGFNPIQVCHNYSSDARDFRYKMFLNVLRPSLTKPMYQTSDGSQMLMTPHMARLNNLTYACSLYVDIHIITEIINADGVTERTENTVNGVCIGKLPIMVRSKACVLTQMPTVADGLNGSAQKHECRFDYGGYFVVNGNEKVVVSQDRISENKTLVFAPNCTGDGLNAEIRSMPDLVFLPPKTTSLHMAGKPNHMGHVIRLNASFLRSEIPLFVMFRALGVESDREIYAHIVLDLESKKNERIIAELAACAEDACDVHTQEDALNVIRSVLGTTGTPKEYLDQPGRTLDIIKNTMKNDFLSHVGPSFKKKALYVGYMVRKLISIHLGYQNYDNRDSYLHKRIDTPGILYANLFRQCYGKLIKDVRNLVVRELNLWRATPNVPMQLITANNIHRFFKQTVIDSGLRYALSTGNWGVKSIGSFQNIRQGVAQVLNRMSYLGMLSHLRRISTPMEKNGKLVQPRKLENTQYGMVCPAETPEGAPVGLVKNMAMSTHITNNTSSALIRDMLPEMGVHMYNDEVADPIEFLRRMGSIDSVSVMINGDLIGFHDNPKEFYDQLKSYKTSSGIPPKTGIVWDIPKNLIYLSTEAGRLCRPLYIVDKNTRRLRIELLKDLPPRFDDLVYGEDDDTACVEFMDVDEIDKAMVAMMPNDLLRGIKGTSLPPIYTHCEIHPSLMCGVLAANIPFMQYNQSPRNCYQCLWVEETVLMVTGERKAIKDVHIGDEVLCFHPQTGTISNTKVVGHIVRAASKPMCKVTTISGRSIVVTTDHKFMTDSGWNDAMAFMDKRTKLGIYYSPPEVTYDTSVQVPMDSVISARMLGYYRARPSLGFDSLADEARYEEDARLLNFNDGYRGAQFLYFIANLKWKDITGTEDAKDVDDTDVLQGVSNNPNETILYASYMSGYYSGILYDTEAGATTGYAYNRKRRITSAKKAEYERYKMFATDPMSWEEWDVIVQERDDLLMVPVLSRMPLPKTMVADIEVESMNHSFIGGDGFAVSNSAMGKQAVGVYASNFNTRTDTMAHVLHYPQRPLVRTQLSKYTNVERLPSGINAVVAIMTNTGFNQEDSVILNKSAIDRGLFTTTYFKSYRDQCSKNHSTGEEEMFMKPISDMGVTTGKGKPKPFNYDKLGDDGFVPKDTYVDSADILVGKVMPHKVHGTIQHRDTSMQMKGNDDGCVDMNYTGTNGDGYKFCKIRLRKYRKPMVGDKLASTHAQKGTVGMVYNDCDMPFTKDGIRPDIIMNPHAVPSRMTIAQLMECLMSKAACGLGACGDATPFTSCSVESIAEQLEKSGYERYGNEILYNGRTGKQIETAIFIGPTYYQRLKHMVSDKCHCLTEDTEVLTTTGWKFIQDITMDDEVATLADGARLVYTKPLEVLEFPNYKGKMYHISNQAIDLDVTINHRMLVKTSQNDDQYTLVPAEDIVGKRAQYKTNATWDVPDYVLIGTCQADMDAWLMFFGIWYVEGAVRDDGVEIAVNKQHVKDALYPAIDKLGFTYTVHSDVLSINHKHLHAYMVSLSQNRSLPSWVWKLSMGQARKLIQALQLQLDVDKIKSSSYLATCVKFADDVQRLCLHAGWSAVITKCHTSLHINIIKTKCNPIVNNDSCDIHEEYTYDYERPVYCLQVPSEVFLVRKNGKAVWTGNSRASNGPIVLLTRQPAEGRARNGGLRFGEMERDGIVGHGAGLFLKERMLDVSDNFRVFPCRKCGLISVANPEKNIYRCGSCKTSADITQVRIPYSMKLLMQELETMSVAARMIF